MAATLSALGIGRFETVQKINMRTIIRSMKQPNELLKFFQAEDWKTLLKSQIVSKSLNAQRLENKPLRTYIDNLHSAVQCAVRDFIEPGAGLFLHWYPNSGLGQAFVSPTLFHNPPCLSQLSFVPAWFGAKNSRKFNSRVSPSLFHSFLGQLGGKTSFGQTLIQGFRRTGQRTEVKS